MKMAGSLGEKLLDLEARIEGVFPLSIGDPDGAPDWFEAFCEDCDSASMAVFKRFPALDKFVDGDEYPTSQEVAEAVIDHNVDGWVCRVAYCPRKYIDAN